MADANCDVPPPPEPQRIESMVVPWIRFVEVRWERHYENGNTTTVMTFFLVILVGPVNSAVAVVLIC